MLLQKVDTFEKAINVLLSEEQANSDTRQCSESVSEPRDAEVFATSAYKRDQRSERQNFSTSKSMPKPDYICVRCKKAGRHFQHECPSLDRKCMRCEKRGHFIAACDKKPERTGYANAIRAHVEQLSPNDLAVFNASQIEKAEHCGLVYNVETNYVDNPENMNRHQEFGMFGHLK